MSTSDEEDNDSDSSGEEEDQKQDNQEISNETDQSHLWKAKKSKPKKVEKDVVRTLIERDPALLERDLQARLYKIQQWKKLRKKFGFLNEDYDVNEDFSWWHFADDKVYYAMGAKYKTYYRKGD